MTDEIDRLRERARSLRQGRWSDGPDDALMMERAADTIWELRELCADLVRQIKLAEYFDCFGCKCEKWGECDGECTFERRARELGIEVK
jgi:hypothetical protein